jgi:hypothetical protein
MKLWILMIVSSCCCMAQVLMQQRPAEKPDSAQSPVTAPVPNSYPLDAFRDFSAIEVGSMMPTDSGEFHIYRSGNLLRTEAPQGKVFFITDLKTFESWAVSARGCFHSAQPYFRSKLFTSIRPGFGVERVALDPVTEDGHTFKVENITITPPEPARSIRLKFFEAGDLQGFPIKIEMLRMNGDIREIRFKGVVLGPQDPTLFVHPTHCDTMDSFQMPMQPSAPPAAKAPAPGSEKPPKK